jgi:hypothetical protein
MTVTTSPAGDRDDGINAVAARLDATLAAFQEVVVAAQEQVAKDREAFEEAFERRQASARRRFGWWVAAGFMLVVALVAGALAWQRGQAADGAAFRRLADERYANCQVSRVRTAAHVELVRAQLASDEVALERLTGPQASDAARAFAHDFLDGRIASGRAFLKVFPDEPIVCTAPSGGG